MTSHFSRQQMQQLWHELKKQGRKTPEHRMLTSQKYRTPSDFTNWEIVAERLAAQCFTLREYGSQLRWDGAMFSQTLASTISTYLAHQAAPVLWLNKSLLESMLRTQIPKRVGQLKRPLPMGTIMLPERLIQTPDGEVVDFISFAHRIQGELLPTLNLGSSRHNQKQLILRSPAVEFDQLQITTVTANQTIYSSNMALVVDQQGQLELADTTGKGWMPAPYYALSGEKLNSEETEVKFLRVLDSIVLQCIFILQFRPQLVSPAQESDAASGLPFRDRTRAKRGVSNTHKVTPLNPRWIGRDYSSPQERFTPQGGTHASPCTHWRTGY